MAIHTGKSWTMLRRNLTYCDPFYSALWTTIDQRKKTKDANFDVAVFKTNLYRNWDISTGIDTHDGSVYIPVELQRNYSKDHAIAAEIHIKLSGKDDSKKVNGGEVKWVVKTDNVFWVVLKT